MEGSVNESSRVDDEGEDAKKRKLNDCAEEDYFKDFSIIKILNQNAQHKSIFVHGRFGNNDQDAILILEKSPFNEKSVIDMLKAKIKVTEGMHNDIYRTQELYPSPEYAAVKSTVIYPATTKHLAKYSSQMAVMVNETPEDYERVVTPYIKSSSLSRQWVYNILEKQSEVERILFEDNDPVTGFVLVPDMKWDGKQLEDLYLVAFAKNKLLHSIRDLRSEHAALLRNIRDQGVAVILEKYGIPKSGLRIFLHYVPSYFHLHVHFTQVGYDAPGIAAGRAHLLEDVINNLELFDNFYQRKTMTYVLRENDHLYQCYRTTGQV